MKNPTTRAAALILAGLLALGPAKADEQAAAKADADAATETTETQRELARKANEQAARKAAKAVQESTKLDLDIRLIGPTSVTIAGDHPVAR